MSLTIYINLCIGGSVGGAVVLLAALAAAFLFWRRRKGNSRRGPGLNTGTEYIR